MAQSLLWVRQYGPTQDDGVEHIAVDQAGNVIAAGWTRGNLGGITVSGALDGYVRKFDPNGNVLWTRLIGTTNEDRIDRVAVDSIGNVYVAGWTFGTFPNQTSAGNQDAFVAKLDSGGNLQWIRQLGSSDNDRALGVSVDSGGNVIVAGLARAPVVLRTFFGGTDVFVRKYDANGNVVWTDQFGTSADDVPLWTAVDSNNRVIVGGYTGGQLPSQQSAGGSDAFVRVYTTGGTVVWTKQFGTSGDEGSNAGAVDGLGNIYTTGDTSGVFPSQTGKGGSDGYLVRLSSDGVMNLTKQFGSSVNDAVVGLARDPSGNILLSGASGNIPGNPCTNTSADAALWKFDSAGSQSVFFTFGSTVDDFAGGVGVDSQGNIFAGGKTCGSMPMNTHAGGEDSWVARISLTQTVCSYSLNSASASFSTQGGNGSVTVSTGATCPWMATGAPAWVSFTSATSVTGSGTLQFHVDATTSGLSRSVTLTVAGLPFIINEDGLGCQFGLSPTSTSIPAAANSGTVQVTASAQDCPRAATSNANWLTITSGGNVSGSGTLGYFAAANTQPTSRTGSLNIGNQQFTVTQAAQAPCSFSLPQTSRSVESGGGSSFAVISTQAGCGWSGSSDSPWIHLDTTSGIGSSEITFRVDPNSGPNARTAILTLQALQFLVTQAGVANPVSCSAASTPSSVRAEGRTELTGDIVVTCMGSPSAPLTGDFLVKWNAPVSSRRLDAVTGTTEALILVNDPASPQRGANAFLGQLTGPNQILWAGLPLLPAGNNVSRMFRIKNARVDASYVGLSGTQQTATITAQVAVQSVSPVPVTNSSLTVANAQAGVIINVGAIVPGATGNRVETVSFQERFANAFKPRLATGQDPSTPSTAYPSESGYVNSSLLGNSVGFANTATRLRISVSNVPSGVSVVAPQTSMGNNAQLLRADGSGFANSSQTIPLTNGSGSATWEITSTNTNVVETQTFQLSFDNPGGADLSPLRVTGSLATVSNVGVSSVTELIPRFRDVDASRRPVNLRLSLTSQAGTGQRPVLRAPEIVRVGGGGIVSSTYRVVNDTDSTANNSGIGNNLPSTLELISCTTSTGATCTIGDNGIQAGFGALGPGQDGTVTVVARVSPRLPAGTVIESRAGAYSTEDDSELDNNLGSYSIVVAEGCFYDINKTIASVGAAGDLGSVEVVTAPGCMWTTESNVNWITLTPVNGMSAGPARYRVEANTTNQPRTGVITVAGRTVQITQAPAGCSYGLSLPSTTIAPEGGNLNLQITATPGNCSWTVAGAPGWVTLPTGNSGSANGSLLIVTKPNTTPRPRTGTLVLAGNTLQLLQQRSMNPPPTPLFSDVSLNHPFGDLITLLRQNAVTSGCTSANYCPDTTTTRGEMAVFIIRSIFGGDNFPYPGNPYFTDVADTHPFFRWIQKMRELGITAGCTATTYCPDAAVTRGEMAVFLIRGRLGIASGATFPSPSGPFFVDVGGGHPFFPFIQKMRELGITGGCSATEYCPNQPTTRGQMAVFLIRAFYTP